MACTPTCVKPSPTQAHCGACHRTWSGISLFDRHRKGGHCTGPHDLTEAGVKVRLAKGVWRYDEPRPAGTLTPDRRTA